AATGGFAPGGSMPGGGPAVSGGGASGQAAGTAPAGNGGGVSAPGMSALHSLLDAARHTQAHGHAAGTGTGTGDPATVSSPNTGSAQAPASPAGEASQPVPSQAVMDVLGRLQAQA